MRDIDAIDANAKTLADRLASALAVSFDSDQASQLALIKIMPLEEDAEPLAICDDVLIRHPHHPLATLVRAYLSLHYLMDDGDLQTAAGRLESLIERRTEVAAAALLLADIRQNLTPDSRLAETVELVQVSINAEPTWTLNHQMMAWALRESGDVHGARAEFDLAIAHRIPSDVELSTIEWAYAAAFTGQVTNPGYIESERDALDD